MRIRSAAAAGISVALLALLGGCELDTETFTEVAEDGSAVRTIVIQAKDMDKRKEAETFPVKRYVLPADPAWKVEESSDVKLSAKAEIKPGQPIPGGYERQVAAVDRKAGNRVKLELRDHFLCTEYVFEERFADTVKEDEFKKVMMESFDTETNRMLEAFEKEFSESHDLAPARKYVTKDLRKLFEDTSTGVARSGLWAAVGGAVLRLAFGGFPFKKVDQLMQADPREVLKALLAHCLNKAQLKPDAANDDEEKAHAALVDALTKGAVDEQAAARKKLEALGPCVLGRLDKALKTAAAGSGAATRLEETAKAIRAALDAKRDAVIQRLAKETEDAFLKAPPEKKAETEKRLAQMLGAHIEGNFASVEYMFLVRVKLPGELAWFDENGYKLRDGSLRWNFSALNFFQREYACAARSRVWKEANVEALASVFLGDPKALTLRQRSTLDDELAKLEPQVLARVTAALAACAEQKAKTPLEKLASGADGPDSACAKKILEALAAPS
ncbi:MAG: hypothetical protein HY291_16570 [Planctomycetes bacterium]|nr:hypothetical protein [Planctomycetota bacterium]